MTQYLKRQFNFIPFFLVQSFHLDECVQFRWHCHFILTKNGLLMYSTVFSFSFLFQLYHKGTLQMMKANDSAKKKRNTWTKRPHISQSDVIIRSVCNNQYPIYTGKKEFRKESLVNRIKTVNRMNIRIIMDAIW